MLIKSADDKSKRLALLLELQNSSRLDDWQKKRLGDELLKVRRGIQGEKDAAHYLDNHFIDGKNHAVILTCPQSPYQFKFQKSKVCKIN